MFQIGTTAWLEALITEGTQYDDRFAVPPQVESPELSNDAGVEAAFEPVLPK
jgi:hypothetical protein